MKPKPAYCLEHCTYSGTGYGFCAPLRPAQPKVLLVLEAAGHWEALLGRPLSGNTGGKFEREVLRPLGLPWDLFMIDNTLRCQPPENRYPTGKEKLAAQGACRYWDAASLHIWRPNVVGVTYHPAVLFEEPQKTLLIQEAVKRAVALSAKFRPVLCMGQRAVEVLAPWLLERGSVKTWHGHFELFKTEYPQPDPDAARQIEQYMEGLADDPLQR